MPSSETKLNLKKNENRLSQPIRVGIVGAGLMGKWHAAAAEKAGGRILCVADTDANQSITLAKKFSGAQGFHNVATMIKEIPIDVLHICTPLASHIEIAEIAITREINLLIEKPLAATAQETADIYTFAMENNVKLCPAHQFVFQDGVQKAIAQLPEIGRLIHLRATIHSAGGDNYEDEILDSFAIDIIPHPLSLFQRILNDLLPNNEWKVFRSRSGELSVFGQQDETSLSISISMNARPTLNSLQIFGTKGTIHLDLFHGFAVLETGKVSRTRKILRPFDFAVKSFSAATLNLAGRSIRNESAYPGLRRLVSDFYNSIRNNSDSPISGQQAQNIAEIRDFIIRSVGVADCN